MDAKFGQTSNSIHDFRNEINSLQAKNRQYASNEANVPFSQSETNLMTQIQHERVEQDEVLDDMSTVLQRLHVMSQDIGNEIVDQQELLNETADAADSVYDRMKRVEHKMNELIKEKGLTPCKVIAILSCMVVVLLMLIFWS